MYKKILLFFAITSLSAILTPTSSLAQTTGFQTPTGNIQCELVGEEQEKLRCEIGSSLRPRPPQPYRGFCEFDWGDGLLLSEFGKPNILCISDTIRDRNKYVLPYGSSWSNGGFTCVSRRTGLTCTNTTGNGFFLSREKWRVF
ncbi:DUF6636 domain-containing protein [Nostoc sp. CMAA1605]|uniref:DUF6636 domain-containing protein n=1 Tax=Nostoc sp. CMAA1605 TaxID=2055159 RepID=UPI001F2E1C21|nr:DUF6636 domain-containing protein [Nostoc sp. CMAA1605]MCF4966613.1 hypothetical protein [Nostoc sp. CMAA1605]